MSSVMDIETREYGSPTSDEIWRYLQMFVIESREFYRSDVTLTVATGDQLIDLEDGSVASSPVWYPGRVWIGDYEIQGFTYDAFQNWYPVNAAAFSEAGLPTGWAVPDEDGGSFIFDRPIDADTAALTFKIDGYALHPDVTSDDTELQLTRRAYDPAAEYIACKLAIPVINNGTESNRIASYAASAKDWIDKRAARQKIKFGVSPKIGTDMRPYGW